MNYSRVLLALGFLTYAFCQNISIEDLNNLKKTQTVLKTYYESNAKDGKCKIQNVQSAVTTFKEGTLWSQSTLQSRQPVLVQTSCFDITSLGNTISEYMEVRVCAQVSKLHYIDISENWKVHEFFEGFPNMSVHPNPDLNYALNNIQSICGCPSICHEWGYGLMHKNMNIIKQIFDQAMSHYADIIQPFNKSLSTNNSPTPIVGDFPFIPDAAIHYRCGDNVVTHYGFLPFSAFKKVIPIDSKYIYVMAESPSRKPKAHMVSKCQAIFEALEKYLKSNFPNSKVIIMRGNDIFDDLLRMTYAKVLVCSVSTFCLWPAVTNNHSAYYPVTKLIAKAELNFDYGQSFHWLKDQNHRPILGIRAASMSNNALINALTAN